MIQTLFGSTEEKPSFLKRMKEAVTRTRESLSERIEDVVAFRKEIDRETLDDLEATLISADLGTATTATILDGAAREGRSQAGGERRRAQTRVERRAAGDPECRGANDQCRKLTASRR